MARPQRDRLAFAAVLIGGACVVVVAGVIVSVLRAPAVPRPRGVITVVEPVAASPALPAASVQKSDRDDARVPASSDAANPSASARNARCRRAAVGGRCRRQYDAACG